MRGQGTYKVLFSNIDSELRLWINNKLVSTLTTQRPTIRVTLLVNEFEIPLRPFYGGPDNPGDIAPVGLAGVALKANVEQIKVHRDVYYVAKSRPKQDPSQGRLHLHEPCRLTN